MTLAGEVETSICTRSDTGVNACASSAESFVQLQADCKGVDMVFEGREKACGIITVVLTSLKWYHAGCEHCGNRVHAG